jgi:hypothetical protein
METKIPKNEKAGELLSNWSKWLISINFFATLGCVVALKSADNAASNVGVFFFSAILSFSLSIVCSTLFVLLIAVQVLRNNPAETKLFLWLAYLQWFLFIAGAIFVLLWIGVLSGVLPFMK